MDEIVNMEVDCILRYLEFVLYVYKQGYVPSLMPILSCSAREQGSFQGTLH